MDTQTKEEKIQKALQKISADFSELIQALKEDPIRGEDQLFTQKMGMFKADFIAQYKSWMLLTNRKRLDL